MDLQLRRLPDPHWVAQLDRVDERLWALRNDTPEDSLWSVTTTKGEVSVVSAHANLPHQTSVEGPWSVFEVAGPLDFSLVGVLHTLTGPLKKAGVSVFVTSTYDTDFLLVPAGVEASAREAWRAVGIRVD